MITIHKDCVGLPILTPSVEEITHKDEINDQIYAFLMGWA